VSETRIAGTPSRLLGLLVAGATLAIDQIHKVWMIEVFDIGARQPIRVLPFLDLVMAWNPGISYSLFRADSAAGRAALLAFSLTATLGLGIWMWRTPHKLTALALGFIIGGALGNAWDRYAYGAVADFFHFHTPFSLGPLSNYVFNIADVGIVAGVGLLLYESLLVKEDRSATSASP
jgi:signal peptidase II